MTLTRPVHVSLLATLPKNKAEEFTSPIAISSNGEQFAAGIAIQPKQRGNKPQYVIKLWSMADGQEIATFRDHEKPVTAVCFSPDGEVLVSAGKDQRIKVWRLTNHPNHPSLEIATHGVPFNLSINAESRLLLARFQRFLRENFEVWQLPEGRSLYKVNATIPVFAPDGKHLIYGIKRVFKVWQDRLVFCNAQSGQLIRSIRAKHTPVGRSGICSPDGQTLAVQWLIDGPGDDLELLDIHTGERRFWAEGGAVSFAAEHHPESESYRVAIALPITKLHGIYPKIAQSIKGSFTGFSNQCVAVYDSVNWQPIHICDRYAGRILSLTFGDRGTRLAGGNTKGEIILWHGNTGEILTQVKAHPLGVHLLQFGMQDKRLLSGGLSSAMNTPTDPSLTFVKTLSLWRVEG